MLATTLRLGLTSFGGPIAHIGYHRGAYVVRRRWLDERAFAELVALCQMLPGPASSQLAVAAGRARAGWAGAVAAIVGFTLPSAVIMTLVGLAATGGDVPTTGLMAGAIAGLKVAAVAVVAHAVVAMARRLTPDAPRLAIAAVAAVIALALPVPFTQLVLIVAGAVIGRWLLRGPPREAASMDDLLGPAATGSRRAALALSAAFGVLVVGSQVAALVLDDPGVDFFAAFVRAGALVFGGGHVVLPLLDAGIVAPGWVTPDQFLAGYGVAQALPGPLFTFAAYLGVISTAGPGGVAGAVLATIAIFLPGVLLVLAALPVVGMLRDRPHLRPSLDGINASVVGILAAALVNPVAVGGITSPAAAVIAAGGAVLLLTGRVPPLAVVAGSAVLMAVLGA